MHDALDQIAAGIRDASAREHEDILGWYRFICNERSLARKVDVHELLGFDSDIYEAGSRVPDRGVDVNIVTATMTDAELEAILEPYMRPLRECEDLRDVAELLGLRGNIGD